MEYAKKYANKICRKYASNMLTKLFKFIKKNNDPSATSILPLAPNFLDLKSTLKL